MPSNRFPLTLLGDAFAVCKLDPRGPVPAGLLDPGGIACIMRTDDELSVLCLEDEVPPGALKVERGFRAFKLEGPVPFTTVGVVSSLTKPLAEAGISVFVVSTYDTDYLMVNAASVDRASKLLGRAGFVVADGTAA